MSKEIPFAVAGLGRIGWRHAMNIRNTEGLRLAALCDNDASILKKAEAEFSVPVFDDYSGMLKQADASAVTLAIPSHLHYDMAMQAIKEGYSLLIEKPISETADEAIAIKQAAERAGVFLTVNQTFRYRPDVLFVRRIVESGVLGKIYQFELCNTLGLTERTDWQIWKKYNGGQLANLGVHLIDAVLYILQQEPSAVYGKLWQILDKGDLEDCLKVVMEFSDECLADVEVVKATYSRPDWYVCGSSGTLIGNFQTDPPKMLLDVKYQKGGDILEESEIVDFTIHHNQVGEHYKDLADALMKNHQPPVSIDSVIRTMQVLDDIRKADTKLCVG